MTHDAGGGNNTPNPGRFTRLFAAQLEAMRAEATCKTCSGTGKGKGYQPKNAERTGLTKDGRPSKCGDCRGRGILGPASKAEWLTLERVMSHRNNGTGLATASALTMGKATGLNRGTVQRALRRLVSRGLIEATGRGPSGCGTVRYFVPIPATTKATKADEEARDGWRAPARQEARTRATGDARITRQKELDRKNYAASSSTSAQSASISACDLCGIDGLITVTNEEGYRTSQICSHPGPSVTLSQGPITETDRDRLLSEMQQESKTVQSIEERL